MPVAAQLHREPGARSGAQIGGHPAAAPRKKPNGDSAIRPFRIGNSSGTRLSPCATSTATGSADPRPVSSRHDYSAVSPCAARGQHRCDGSIDGARRATQRRRRRRRARRSLSAATPVRPAFSLAFARAIEARSFFFDHMVRPSCRLGHGGLPTTPTPSPSAARSSSQSRCDACDPVTDVSLHEHCQTRALRSRSPSRSCSMLVRASGFVIPRRG